VVSFPSLTGLPPVTRVIREENNWGQYMSTEPLLVDQTEAYLQGMLDHAGITPDTLNPYKTWNTFKDFARIPVVCAYDGLLFEVLPVRSRGGWRVCRDEAVGL
jgi:hypothetical protein